MGVHGLGMLQIDKSLSFGSSREISEALLGRRSLLHGVILGLGELLEHENLLEDRVGRGAKHHGEEIPKTFTQKQNEDCQDNVHLLQRNEWQYNGLEANVLVVDGTLTDGIDLGDHFDGFSVGNCLSELLHHALELLKGNVS